MSRQSSSLGFTVIESVLFLAISGILVMALVIGTGASINIQRYRDAVETFKTSIQNQYSALSSVRNDRTDDWVCGAQAQTQESASGEVRGQSECILVGRYMEIVEDSIAAYSVTALPPTASPSVTDDITSLRDNYVLNVSTTTDEETVLEWGAKISWPVSGTGSQPVGTSRSLALLFVRSPDSGQVYTFSSNTVPQDPTPQTLQDMLVAGASIPGQSERTICIDSNGAFFTTDLSVYIAAYANGPSAVETRSNSFILSTGSDTQC